MSNLKVPPGQWSSNPISGMLKSGCFDESWRATLFAMLPKMGDTSRPSCWRPIANSQNFLQNIFQADLPEVEDYIGQPSKH